MNFSSCQASGSTARSGNSVISKTHAGAAAAKERTAGWGLSLFSNFIGIFIHYYLFFSFLGDFLAARGAFWEGNGLSVLYLFVF